MTLLSEDDGWLADCLFDWLADARTRDILIRRGRATAHGIRILGGLLHAHLTKKASVDIALVRKEMLNILEDRTARISIARKTLMAELEDYEMDPTNPPPRSTHEIRMELQALRTELAAVTESEGLIVRPWRLATTGR